MQMKSVAHIVPFGILFLFTGCVTLYRPNAVYSPLLKEKGDLNTSGSVGLSGCGLYNLQAAYAISEHTGIMVDGMYHRRHISSDDASVDKLNMFFGEAGAGYFTPLGKKKIELFQVYGGGGYGITTDKIDNAVQPQPEVNAKYFNIFIQPGLALTSRNLQMAFDWRVNYVHLYRIHASLYDKFEWWNTDFKFYSDTSLYFINLEPALTVKAGGEKLKGTFQFGITIPAINSHSYFMANTSSRLGMPLIKLSLGITYAFGKKRQEQIPKFERP